MAIVALVLGILGLALSHTYFVHFALPFTVGAIILGAIAARRPGRNRVAIAALVSGGLGLISVAYTFHVFGLL